MLRGTGSLQPGGEEMEFIIVRILLSSSISENIELLKRKQSVCLNYRTDRGHEIILNVVLVGDLKKLKSRSTFDMFSTRVTF